MVTLTWALVRHLRLSQKSLLYPSYTSANATEKKLEWMGKGRVRSRSRVQSHDPDCHMSTTVPTLLYSTVHRHPH